MQVHAVYEIFDLYKYLESKCNAPHTLIPLAYIGWATEHYL